MTRDSISQGETPMTMGAKRICNQVCLGYPGRRCRSNSGWIIVLSVTLLIATLNLFWRSPITRVSKVYLRLSGKNRATNDPFANDVISGKALPSVLGTPLKSNSSDSRFTPELGQQKESGTGILHKHRVPIGTCTNTIDNIAFLKVHKCASSSVANMLVRYGLKKDLNFALPKLDNGHIGWPNSFQPTHALNIQEGQPINIIAYHIIYNKANLEKVMPKGSKVVAILREPWSQFKSSMNFFKELKQMKFKTKDTLKEFIENPPRYEKKLFFALGGKALGYKSVTHNFLSTEMGLPEDYFHDEGKIREYIHFLDENVDLVMLKEYFSQSVVLMRRLMCWSMDDVITMPINSKKYKMNHQEAALKEKHKKWSAADYMMYDYFNRTFHRKVQAEGPNFLDEVKQFDKLNNAVEAFCKLNKSKGPLTLEPSKWNGAIQITRETCRVLKIIPYYMTGMLKKKMVDMKNKRRKGVQAPPQPAKVNVPPPVKNNAPPPAKDNAPPPAKDNAKDKAPPPAKENAKDNAPPPAKDNAKDNAPPPAKDNAPPPGKDNAKDKAPPTAKDNANNNAPPPAKDNAKDNAPPPGKDNALPPAEKNAPPPAKDNADPKPK